MMTFRGANADTGGGNQLPASALAAEVEDAWAARALGEDRVVEFGRYRLLRIIGRGGMGQVFEAWDPQLERHVAIKLVLRGGARATLEEARCLARVGHPNVVSVHDVGRVGELVYIAMELVDGPDLRGWLRAETRSWTNVLEVMLAAGRGLAAVHDAGLLHGDVKPGNVLVGRDGRVRVADFGLARAETRLGDACNPELDELVRRALEAVDRELVSDLGPERSGTADDVFALDELRLLLAGDGSSRAHAGGTVAYMAPERRCGSDGGTAADQYSFCATAREALAQKPCPSAVLEVLRKGMAEQPEARWSSMDALCSALQRARDRAANRTRKMMLASALTMVGVVGVLATGLLSADTDAVADCERQGEGIGARWGPEQRAALRLRFSSSTVPRGEARFVIDRLDAWAEDWSTLWTPACVADSDVRTCLDDERERFEAVLSLLEGGELEAAQALVSELGSPTVCLDANRGPSLSVAGIGRLAELSAIERRVELAVLAGAHERASDELRAFDAALIGLAAVADPTELKLHLIAIEPLRARVLAANGEGGLARTRLRAAIREAEARGHDGLRFALLLEQTRMVAAEDPVLREPPTMDDLAALDGLAERVDAGPVARAELVLIRAGLPGAGADREQLTSALETAGEALATHQPEGYAELRLELALRRAELHFHASGDQARDLAEALRAAEQAWAVGKSSPERSSPRLFAALTIAGASAALLGDCDRVGPLVTALLQLEQRPGVELATHRDSLLEMSDAIDWVSVRRACPEEGANLHTLFDSIVRP
jgi:hypothetical protein